MIRVKRVYDPIGPEDGRRFLIDRLWPRGKTREALHLAAWLKDVAPSQTLRQWFGHDPSRWEEFQRRYAAELDGKPAVGRPLLNAASQGDITLLYSAQDIKHNNAIALKAYLEKTLGQKKAPHP